MKNLSRFPKRVTELARGAGWTPRISTTIRSLRRGPSVAKNIFSHNS